MAATDDGEVPPGRRTKCCTYCGYGETGRRAGFRFQWGNPSEFKSLYPHQNFYIFFNTRDNHVENLDSGCPNLISPHMLRWPLLQTVKKQKISVSCLVL